MTGSPGRPSGPSGAAASTRERLARVILEGADELLERGDLSQALVEYDNARRLAPEMARERAAELRDWAHEIEDGGAFEEARLLRMAAQRLQGPSLRPRAQDRQREPRARRESRSAPSAPAVTVEEPALRAPAEAREAAAPEAEPHPARTDVRRADVAAVAAEASGASEAPLPALDVFRPATPERTSQIPAPDVSLRKPSGVRAGTTTGAADGPSAGRAGTTTGARRSRQRLTFLPRAVPPPPTARLRVWLGGAVLGGAVVAGLLVLPGVIARSWTGAITEAPPAEPARVSDPLPRSQGAPPAAAVAESQGSSSQDLTERRIEPEEPSGADRAVLGSAGAASPSTATPRAGAADPAAERNSRSHARRRPAARPGRSDAAPKEPARHWRVHAPSRSGAAPAAPGAAPAPAPSAPPTGSPSLWKRHAPNSPEPSSKLPAVGGLWTLSEWLVNKTSGRRCAGEGVLSLRQLGVSLGGRARGEDPCSERPTEARISEGSVEGRTIAFSSGECEYSGTVVGQPAMEMLGNVRCRVRGGAGEQLLTGTWRAAKEWREPRSR